MLAACELGPIYMGVLNRITVYISALSVIRLAGWL